MGIGGENGVGLGRKREGEGGGGGTRGEGEGGEGALHVEAREVVWRGRVLVSDRPNPCRRHACSRSAYASSAAELVSSWCVFSSTRFRVHALFASFEAAKIRQSGASLATAMPLEST